VRATLPKDFTFAARKDDSKDRPCIHLSVSSILDTKMSKLVDT
jgi:hypothetical protein